ncbi:hypothetical protein C0Z11_10380 [Acidipropionibacterium jensenii]|nr:hypothetical protein C0Z11_10380 [Acidipropionibacterium jensenii]
MEASGSAEEGIAADPDGPPGALVPALADPSGADAAGAPAPGDSVAPVPADGEVADPVRPPHPVTVSTASRAAAAAAATGPRETLTRSL